MLSHEQSSHMGLWIYANELSGLDAMTYLYEP